MANLTKSDIVNVWIVNKTTDLIFYDGSEDGDNSYWYFHRYDTDEVSQEFISRLKAEKAWDGNTIIWGN